MPTGSRRFAERGGPLLGFRPRGSNLPESSFGLNIPTRLDNSARPHLENKLNPVQGYLGPTLPGARPYITTGTRDDFLASFNKRANWKDESRIDDNIKRGVRAMNKKLVPEIMKKFSWDKELYERWLSGFDTEKRNRMEKAYNDSGLDRLSDYSNKQIFTKIEALVKNHNTVAGRLIFKGTDLYNMLSGPIFMELMRRFLLTSNNLDTTKFKVAYKQDTQSIVDHLESIRAATHIEADFSANDKSQVKDVQDLEIDFMRRLGCPSWFLRLHRRTNRFNVYSTKYGMHSQVCFQLPSGCTDGTFRNTYWNLALFHTWCRRRKIVNSRSVFLGDDMLARLPKRPRTLASSYARHCSLAKMTAKVTSFRSLRQGHFLSKHFYPVEGHTSDHVMLPFVGKVLAKFNTRPNANNSVSDDAYMAGKALSHAYEFRHCHAISQLFRERASVHLEQSGGAYSVLAFGYHARGVLLSLGPDVFFEDCPDLVKRDDLDNFWQMNWGLVYAEVMDLFRHVVLGHPTTMGIQLVAAESIGDL